MPNQEEEKSREDMTEAQRAMHPEPTPDEVFQSEELINEAFYADNHSIVFHAEAREALSLMAEVGLEVDCIVTSPPFYGQRDYEVDGQIGLELDPNEFIEELREVFEYCRPVLKKTGSLWVNLGDTYWSAKGQHKSDEKKQSARRFGLRPQDRTREGVWTRPKQRMLMPHRVAIALQEDGWLVRNDNVWVKPNPIPDQVRDRCSITHEYVFHFAKNRWYYFDKDDVGIESSRGTMLPPRDTWEVGTSRGNGSHKASFSEELVRIPILSTTPENGIVLDPFCGTGTSLRFAKKHGFRSVGIDLKESFCEETVESLRSINTDVQGDDIQDDVFREAPAKRKGEQTGLFDG
jgi:site-specific DNA-methyltransferase (adenine-specific)